MSTAFIQFQDKSGNWIPCGSVPNESINIIQGMERAATLYRGSRIRAVDDDGRLLDNL